MAQTPKRPTTRRPKSGTAHRATPRKTASATPAPATAAGKEATPKPKRTRAAKAAAPTPAAAAPAARKAPVRRTRAVKTAAPAPSPARSKQRHDQAEHQARDSHGRFKVSRRARTIALGLGGAVLAVGAGLGTALWRGWVKMPRGPFGGNAEGHEAPDLALDAPKPGTKRAPDAFRPDPTAVPTQEERDALRPIAAD